MEEQTFALMIRNALTEYDFASIDIDDTTARVRLQREVYAENGKGDLLEYVFSDPTLIKVISELKSYLPAL
ncbi:MAG: hypothetical protein QME41_06470 [Actinomycetota bacterium]|nr:hypothetical protein [Actinomycetota bacterium]